MKETLDKIVNSAWNKLKIGIAYAFFGYALISPKLTIADEPKNQSLAEEYGKRGDIHFRNKEYGINKYPIEVGLAFDCLWSFDYKVDVPGKYVPEDPREGYIKHEVVGAAGGRIGPKISLLSTIEASVKYNFIDIGNGEDSTYTTYWGGYDFGDYACIGSVQTDPDPFSYEMTVQTPHLHLGEDITVRGFFTRINESFQMHYKSGYHKYTHPFYEVVDHFKVGDFKSKGNRYGLKFSLFKEVEDLVITFFYQKNTIDGSPTEKGKEFIWDKEQNVFGWGIEGTF